MLGMLRWLSHGFACLGAGVALLVGLMTTVSVIGRAAFKLPIPGDMELTQMGMAFAISLCLPWCQMHRANIAVDFFTQRLTVRSQRWLDAAGCLLFVVMYGLLAWRTAVGAVSVQAAGETSMIMALPMWWAYASLAPGLALAGGIAAVQVLEFAGGRSLLAMPGEAA